MSSDPVEKSHYFAITFPSLFSGRELIDLNFSRMILPPPPLPWVPLLLLGNEEVASVRTGMEISLQGLQVGVESVDLAWGWVFWEPAHLLTVTARAQVRSVDHPHSGDLLCCVLGMAQSVHWLLTSTQNTEGKTEVPDLGFKSKTT